MAEVKKFKKYVPKTTITVNPLTLKWANAIRSMYQYKWGVDMTLDDTILSACTYIDWVNATYSDKSNSLEYNEYIAKRASIFLSDFDDDELVEINAMFQKWVKRQERLESFQEAIDSSLTEWKNRQEK